MEPGDSNGVGVSTARGSLRTRAGSSRAGRSDVKAKATTREQQYQVQIDVGHARGYVPMGPTASHVFRTDPRRQLLIVTEGASCSCIAPPKPVAVSMVVDWLS